MMVVSLIKDFSMLYEVLPVMFLQVFSNPVFDNTNE